MSVKSLPELDAILACCDDWGAFKSTAVSLQSTIERGLAFERLTQLYLQVAPHYSSLLRNVWRNEELPNDIRSKIKLPKGDEGIDLIAEEFTGKIWAVQCKYRANAELPLTRNELGTFLQLAFHHCTGISHALVSHTASHPVKKRHLLPHTSELGLDIWANISPDVWQLIQARLHQRELILQPREPRKHQLKAIHNAVEYFLTQEGTRGRLIMPCGTGKSLTAFWIGIRLDAKTIVVAVPSLALLKQSLETWTREFMAIGEKPSWLCVCSDETVGDIGDDFIVSQSNDLGVPTTTSQSDICEFLQLSTSRRKVVFTTYQSCRRVASAIRETACRIDLAVLDEAHKTVGHPSKPFAALVTGDILNIRHRLFMTATERIIRGDDEDVLSMDDVSIYGKPIFVYTFKEAIDDGVICDYKIVALAIRSENVADAMAAGGKLLFQGHGNHDSISANANSLVAAIAIHRLFSEQDVHHAISYHRSIRGASDFVELVDQVSEGLSPTLSMNGFHVSGRQLTSLRQSHMRAFAESERAFLTNARCLNEGVDIPVADCVVFVDPRNSTVDIVQAVGRVLRPHPTKRCAFVLIPLPVADGSDVNATAESTEFRHVARVVTALSMQDERIVEQLSGRQGRRSGHSDIFEVRNGEKSGQDWETSVLFDDIRIKLWERVGRLNWRSFENARVWARLQNVKTSRVWRELSYAGKIPPDIPSDPSSRYRKSGWTGWRDWLGTEKEYWSFEVARDWARQQNVRTAREWRGLTRSKDLPAGIPSQPDSHYKDKGWCGWSDWLGTEKRYIAFEAARDWARKKKLATVKGWLDLSRSGLLPPDIPRQPNEYYKDTGWVNWKDWLGSKCRDFEEAREWARRQDALRRKDWLALHKSGTVPRDIPRAPNIEYAGKGWVSWQDWLTFGKRQGAAKSYRSFAEAREWARQSSARTARQWRQLVQRGKIPPDIPGDPSLPYRDSGWKGWRDWLGTCGGVQWKDKYLNFDDARAWARQQGIRTAREWRRLCQSGKLPREIPATPDVKYRYHGWISWADWLQLEGNRIKPRREYRSFEAARAWVVQQGIRSIAEWKSVAKSRSLPSDIPIRPDQVYRNAGWTNWKGWLMFGRRPKGSAKGPKGPRGQ